MEFNKTIFKILDEFKCPITIPMFVSLLHKDNCDIKPVDLEIILKTLVKYGCLDFNQYGYYLNIPDSIKYIKRIEKEEKKKQYTNKLDEIIDSLHSFDERIKNLENNKIESISNNLEQEFVELSQPESPKLARLLEVVSFTENNKKYMIDTLRGTCNCPNYKFTNKKCKHIEHVIKNRNTYSLTDNEYNNLLGT